MILSWKILIRLLVGVRINFRNDLWCSGRCISLLTGVPCVVWLHFSTTVYQAWVNYVRILLPFLSETFQLQSIHQLLSHHMRTFLTRFWKILNRKTTRIFFLCSYFSKALGEASMICFYSSLKNTCFMELLHNKLLLDKNRYTVEAFKYNCR